MIGWRRLLNGAKVVVVHLLYYAGLLQLWQRAVMRRRAVVLMYHRVLTSTERQQTASHPAIIVEQTTFERHMALLRRRFVVLSPEEFARRMEQKSPFPPCSCLITFDDGWRDNYTNALPVLERYGLPALIFLPVNYIGGTRLFWQEALIQLLAHALVALREGPERRDTLTALLEPASLEHVLVLPADASRDALHSALQSQKNLSRAEVDHLIASLTLALGGMCRRAASIDGFLDWEQVEEMCRRGVTFGGHGAEHLLLTKISAEDAAREIETSKAELDLRLRLPVPTFSYPNGFWSEPLAERVRKAGYRLAFTTKRGLVSCDDDPFSIRRLNIHESMTSSAPMFLARLVGLL